MKSFVVMKTCWDKQVPMKSFYFKQEALAYCNKMNYIISHYLKYNKLRLDELMNDWHQKNHYQLNIPFFGDPKNDDVQSFLEEEKFYIKLIDEAKIKFLKLNFKYLNDEVELLMEVSNDSFRPFFSIVEVEIK